ncbi:SEC-C metal-binding domain-containing protein [Bremerella sp. T1]|uniref:SEC-C metal-binding domain-containing protein n=1 Tax=Bremerella sp. TYQ1 TaxID=3119568 RepID=UPI001CC99496|nr:SEC-C metal-binding domain-containing protein [Bremerella volcania]UBM37669.1 SEC-C domain-containing protein [Bremerella volcania]
MSRNAACPCGIGKKYKDCCLKHDATASLFGQVLRVVKFRDRQGDDLGLRLLDQWNPPREFIQQ